MKKIVNLGAILSKEQARKIKGGDESLASCTKDCGDGKSVTCDGTACTTVDNGCYGVVDNNVTYTYCPS